jgi:Zn-dependent protease
MFDFDIERILLTLPGILLALSFHEFAHALASDRLGDPTPRAQGRLTLNPLPHIDFIGFMLLIFAGFGWARPVSVDSRYYKNPRRDKVIVSAAGPAMNLFLAAVFAVFLKILVIYGEKTSMSVTLFGTVASMFLYTININLVLFLFNLLPIPPLDGFHILAEIIPPRRYKIIYILQQYSTIILIIIVITPIVSFIIRPPIRFIFSALMRLLNMPMFI